MKSWKKQLIVGLVLAWGTSTALLGQDLTATNSDSTWNSPAFYHAQEVSLDLFGTAAVGQYTLDHLNGRRFHHNVRLGLGAGGNYFFTRYLGVGVDAYSESASHSFVDAISGNLIVRVPIANTGIAPYGFVGGGRQFDDTLQWEGHLGAGVEFRFCPHVGMFVDGRYVFAQTTENYGLGRLGVRFSF